MRRIAFTIMLTLCFGCITHAQDQNNQIKVLQDEVRQIKSQLTSTVRNVSTNTKDISKIKSDVTSILNDVDTLGENHKQLSSEINETNTKLSSDIVATNETLKSETTLLSSSIKNNSYIGGLIIALAVFVCGILFWLARKKMTNNGTAIEQIKLAQEELQKAQKGLEEESVKLDSKLVEILDKQVEQAPKSESTHDHSLALKVADEITRIELNLSRMDSSVKGYKQLSKGVERIKNNFLAKGYEITDMLGKNYNEGMRINADFVLDENLEQGVRIITSITKPQVLYNGELIQKAIVTVTQNI